MFPSPDTALPPAPRSSALWEAPGLAGLQRWASATRETQKQRGWDRRKLLTHPTLSNWYWLAGFGVFFPWSPGYKQLRTESGDSKSLENKKTSVRLSGNTLPQGRSGHGNTTSHWWSMPPVGQILYVLEVIRASQPYEVGSISISILQRRNSGLWKIRLVPDHRLLSTGARMCAIWSRTEVLFTTKLKKKPYLFMSYTVARPYLRGAKPCDTGYRNNHSFLKGRTDSFLSQKKTSVHTVLVLYLPHFSPISCYSQKTPFIFSQKRHDHVHWRQGDPAL